MGGSFGTNLAVPSASLLKSDDVSRLSFETSSWEHLNRYISNVEGLPADFESGSAAADKALDKLRQQVRSFGSPRQLRQLITEQPNALADEPPFPTLYAGIVALIQRLHESAASVVSSLQSLAGLARASGDVKASLQALASKAETARTPIGPLIDSLKTFKAGILNANSELSNAFKADAKVLQQKQEAVGGLQVSVESLQKQIEELGFFATKQKRKALEEQLRSAQQELADNSAQAEKLRAALGQLEPILEEGYWLEAGVDDLVDFLEKLRKVLTTFGSGVAQLVADSSDAQLKDPVWMEKTLGLDEAIKQWTAIEQARLRFQGNAQANWRSAR